MYNRSSLRITARILFRKVGRIMEKKTRNVLGIIHLGTVNMTMKIISYSSLDDMEIIENVAQEVKIWRNGISEPPRQLSITE